MSLAGLNTTVLSSMTSSTLVLASSGTSTRLTSGITATPTTHSLITERPDQGLSRLEASTTLTKAAGTRSFIKSLALAIPTAVVGGVAILFLSNCQFDSSGVGGYDGGSTGDDGGSGDGGTPPIDGSTDDGGSTDGSSDGSTTDGGTTYPADHVPMQSLPADLEILAPTRGYLSWQDGVIPGGNSTWYRSCYANVQADVSDPADCPNESIDINRSRVIDLAPTTDYHWKVQTCYDAVATDCTDYSPVRLFSADNSLIGWWQMDDAAGATAMDSSNSVNDGSLNNFDLLTAWTAGLIGSSLLFDASNDYVDLGSAYNFDSSDTFSIEAWTRRNTGSAVHSIVSRMDFTDSINRRGYRLSYAADDTIRVQLRNNDSTGDQIDMNTTQAFPGSPANPFQNITMTYNGSLSAAGVQIYSDATLQTTTTATDNLTGTTLNSAPTWIGAQVGVDFTTPDRTIDGLVDEVAIFNKVLPSANVVNNLCAAYFVAGISPLPVICD